MFLYFWGLSEDCFNIHLFKYSEINAIIIYLNKVEQEQHPHHLL